MLDAILRPEAGPSASIPIVAAALEAPPLLQRSAGSVRLVVDGGADGPTCLRRLSQAGSARICFPRVAGGSCEAVLVNTSGGLAGGDRFDVEAEAGGHARLTLTTQAAEKIYRSTGLAAEVTVLLRLADQASLAWLPQETILFDQARLTRRLDVEMDVGASLLIAESVIFGRTARGEKVTSGSFLDRWRIRRDGALIFAEQTRLSGGIAAHLARPAIADGAAALASVLLVAPGAEAHLDGMRQALRDVAGMQGGVSAWNGMLALRLVAADGYALRRHMAILLRMLRGAALPRVWQS